MRSLQNCLPADFRKHDSRKKIGSQHQRKPDITSRSRAGGDLFVERESMHHMKAKAKVDQKRAAKRAGASKLKLPRLGTLSSMLDFWKLWEFGDVDKRVQPLKSYRGCLKGYSKSSKNNYYVRHRAAACIRLHARGRKISSEKSARSLESKRIKMGCPMPKFIRHVLPQLFRSE